ncbi:MAG: SEC-C domain-containing protein [Gammaproteobacteria bacterium]|nr:SEC-C domain-containing protein [Gammaproteobacteria bacterium]
MKHNQSCPCGSVKQLKDCCLPIIEQHQVANSPEQLMRSRFTAFYLQHVVWLNASWSLSTRPQTINFENDLKWLDLKIIDAQIISADKGTVEFEARYLKNGKINAIHENSRFIKENNLWVYTDGDYLKPSIKNIKVGRNDVCPCHSGNKYKVCCALKN